MDRCHRIGQQKPVLVIRLATTHSVEGKLLRRANSKLMLERLVIKKGAFIDVGESKGKQNVNMGKSELMDILRSDISLDDVPQSGEVDDAMMDVLGESGMVTVALLRNTIIDKDDMRATVKLPPFDLTWTHMATKLKIGSLVSV